MSSTTTTTTPNPASLSNNQEYNHQADLAEFIKKHNQADTGQPVQMRSYNPEIVEQEEPQEDSEEEATEEEPIKEVEKSEIKNAKSQQEEARETKKDPTEDFIRKYQEGFERLTQKEIELREREARIKLHEADVKRLNDIQEIAKTKGKIGAIQALGWTPEEIAKEHLNGGKPDPYDIIKELTDEVANLRQQVTTKFEENERKIARAEMAAQVYDWQKEFDGLLETEEYRIVKEWSGGADRVKQIVIENHKNTNNILPPRAGLDKVKEELLALLKKVAPYAGLNSEKETPAPVSKSNNGQKNLIQKTASTPLRTSPTRFLSHDEELRAFLAESDRAERQAKK